MNCLCMEDVDLKPSLEWRQATIRDQQSSIREELMKMAKILSPKKRLAYILNEIQDLESEFSDIANMHRFIYAVSALNHHKVYGGLKPKQIKHLENLAEAILKVSKIKPRSSDLSFLYNDICMVKSEIHLKQGEVIESMLERQIGEHLSRKGRDLSIYNELAFGYCHMRLGNVTQSLEPFNRVLASDTMPELKERAAIRLVRAMRISGDNEGALKLIEGFSAEKDARESFLSELQWEGAWLVFRENKELLPIINLVKRHKPHSISSYILETLLAIRSINSVQFFKSLPKLASWTQYSDLHFDTNSSLYVIVRYLEQAYDSEVLFKKRLDDMKTALSHIRKLRSVEQELMAWLAVTRWFHRNRHSAVGSLSFSEYRALSLRVSDGKLEDALCMAEDLLSVDWHKANQKDAS